VEVKKTVHANLSGIVMGIVTKSATSTFQYDDTLTLNAQVHRHSFRDRIQHLNLTRPSLAQVVADAGERPSRPAIDSHRVKVSSPEIYFPKKSCRR
jgi:hypothetical protein